MVDVVQYFNGQQRRVVGQAATTEEVSALVLSVDGAGDGWGVRLRGTAPTLEAVGAYRTLYGAWLFPMEYPRVVDCDVVFADD